MESLVLYFTPLEPQSSLSLSFGNGLPTYEMELRFLRGGTPDEVPLNFVNSFAYLGRQMNELHHMGRDTAEGSFCQHYSASHRKEFSFSASKLCLHIVNYELKVIIDWSGVEDGKAQVFAKMRAIFDAKDASTSGCVSFGAVPREKDFGLAKVDLLPRFVTEGMKNIQNGSTVVKGVVEEKSQIISKEKM